MRCVANMSMVLRRVWMPSCRIGVEDVLHSRSLNDDIVMRQIAGEIERVRPGGDHEAGMADGVAGRVHRLNPRDNLLAIAVEQDAVAVGHEVLPRRAHRAFGRSAGEPFVGPYSRSACAMKICALGKLRLPSAARMPPTWSIWAWLGIR